MEQLSSQEGDISIPLNTSYGGNIGAHVHGHQSHGHGHQTIHHHHPHHHPSQNQNNNNNIMIPSSSSSPPPPPDTLTAHHQQLPPPPHPSNGLLVPISSTPSLENNNDDNNHHHNNAPFKKIIKYKECLKNHAASMGGNAIDGCGEFMPSGEEGTIEALTCSACNCHRNFHRKELEGDVATCYPHYNMLAMNNSRIGGKIFMGHPQNPLGYHHQLITSSSRAVNAQPRQMIMPYGGSLPSDQSDHDAEEGNNVNGGIMMMRPSSQHHHHQMVKKRHRTKFTQEQKEKMLMFAEKVGWKIQKQEEAVVQQFCQEVGVKRRVLKVWMHNNKHNLAKTSVNAQQQADSQNQI